MRHMEATKRTMRACASCGEVRSPDSTCPRCRKRKQRGRQPKSFTVKLKYSLEERGNEVARFASELEATRFLDRLKEIAIETPGTAPRDMLSPFMRGVVDRWLSD